MNLFAIAGLILIFPLLVQIVLGTIIILKKVKWNFDLVCVINIVAQVLSIFIALKLITIDAERQNVRCGMPHAAMLFLGIISTIVLVITIGIQIGIRKYRNRKQTE
jgi:hypothetical protein